ncbi:hypothetical protein BZL35_00149 [Candidatus Pandoraea novymonadis]|uniref:Uncharacterized protein n=1 Tax=Candidatus Pandoraea novymonadis TaxID=1808959 RepID=A0ABX5FDX5_9BURK|nr:hypothetical protein BZL35_00149 [Candidatus Pandoraea novymonadis]
MRLCGHISMMQRGLIDAVLCVDFFFTAVIRISNEALLINFELPFR